MVWDDLSPSCRFLGQVPSPLFNSNSMSNLSFPGKGTDRAVPEDSGFGQAAKGSLSKGSLVGYVFVGYFLCTSIYL